MYSIPLTDLQYVSCKSWTGEVSWEFNGYAVNYTITFYTQSAAELRFLMPLIKAGENYTLTAHIQLIYHPLV